MSRVFVIIFALFLTGCASVGDGLMSAAKTVAALNQPSLSSYDGENAGWIRDAKATSSLRTPRFFANSFVARQLIRSCQQGRWTEVIVYAGGAQEINALKGSCVKVFVSDNPDLNKGFDTLLLDGDTVVVEGHMVAVVNRASRQEYFYRQAVKQQSRQVN